MSWFDRDDEPRTDPERFHEGPIPPVNDDHPDNDLGDEGEAFYPDWDGPLTWADYMTTTQEGEPPA